MRVQPLVITGRVRLKHFATDYDDGRDKEKTKEETDALCRRIGEQQELLHANGRHALLLLFQGIDCAGKDGAIRSVLHHVNPAGVQTAYFQAPSAEEQAHDFLWRVHRAVPRYGAIGVFNRSHYEAVLVERVMLGLPKATWRRRYEQIVEFEQMLAENRVVLLKFFLHLGRDEQAERLRARLEEPRKQWKFQRGDLEVRRRWDDFMVAYEDMLNATSHRAARWHLVPADRKWYRDYVVAQTVLRALEGLRMKWPKPREDLSDVKIK